MYLATTNTLRAKAGTATAITYTIFADEVTTTDAYSPIAQGQLALATTTIYTAPAATQTIITEIQLANTTASDVTGITFYVNGTASSNQINSGFTIPASGSAVYRKDNGWTIYSNTGLPISTSAVTLTGDIAGSGAGTIATTLATVNANVGTFGSNTRIPTYTVNAKGLTTASSDAPVLTTPSGQTPVGATRTLNTTAPITGGGDLSADRTLALTTSPTGQTPVGVTRNIATTAPLTGGGDLSADRTLALTTSPAGQTPVGVTRTLTTTAPLTIDAGASADLSANRTLAISPASTSAAGSESAAQFNTTANQWYDVTNYGVSISNSGATNVAAMNTLIQTTAPGPSRFYFPDTGANYPMTGTITITHNGQTFMGAGMRSSVIFVANTTADLFSITDSVTNITFQDLGFWSTATATAGSVINCGTVSGTGNQQVNFYRIGMEGFGGNHFNGILFNGTRGGEVSNIEDCVLNSFRGWGIATVGNTTVPNTTSALTMTNVLMNGSITGTTGAIAGVYQQQCGALQINSCDIIQCTNNLLTSPLTSTSQVVASVYATNTYFDASHGSCVKFGGTQPTVRCKLVSCSMTVSADATTNYSAIEFSNSATNPPGDIDILNCNIQNTFNNTGTTNGILLTSVSNVKIVGNNINGFTNNIQASAAASSATKLNILGNSIGPGTVSASAAANDILLNSGTYGYVQIVDNIFAPASPFQAVSTTHINDASAVAVASMKNIANNIGIANIGVQPVSFATTRATLPAITVVGGTSIQLQTNSLRVGSRIRFHVSTEKTAAGAAAWILAVKFGTANTTADTAIASWTSGTNTALVDAAHNIIVDILITAIGSGTSATCSGQVMYGHNLSAITGLGSLGPAPTATTAFNSTLANPFLHVDITPGASAVMTAVGTAEITL